MESLEYYLLLVAITVLGIFMSQGKKDRKQYIAVMAVLHSLLSGLRHPYLTGDMQSYCYDYWEMENQGWFSDEVFRGGKNFGFNWLLKFFSTMTDGEYQIFLIIVAIFIEVVVAYLIYKYSSLPWLSYLVWNCMGFYSFGFSAIKQSVAMGLIMIAFIGIMEEKPKLFLAFTALAAFVHAPALIFLPAYYLSRRRFTLATFLIYICGAILIFAERNQIVKIMQDFYYEENLFGDSEGLGGRFFLIVLFILAGFLLRGFNGKYFSRVANLMIVAAILQMFSGFDNVFTRLTDYYLQFLIIFVPLSFGEYRDEQLTGISEGFKFEVMPRLKSVIIIALSGFLIWFYITCYIEVDIIAVDDYTNYRFCWEEWGVDVI